MKVIAAKTMSSAARRPQPHRFMTWRRRRARALDLGPQGGCIGRRRGHARGASLAASCFLPEAPTRRLVRFETRMPRRRSRFGPKGRSTPKIPRKAGLHPHRPGHIPGRRDVRVGPATSGPGAGRRSANEGRHKLIATRQADTAFRNDAADNARRLICRAKPGGRRHQAGSCIERQGRADRSAARGARAIASRPAGRRPGGQVEVTARRDGAKDIE